MSKTKGIIDWFSICPLVAEIEEFDANQLDDKDGAAGVYKQAAVTTQQLIDGSVLVTEYYYLLFRRAAQIKADRLNNDEFCEAIEDWIFDQEFEENYPDIGHEVHQIAGSNAAYMLSRDDDEAVYQLAIAITYMKEV